MSHSTTNVVVLTMLGSIVAMATACSVEADPFDEGEPGLDEVVMHRVLDELPPLAEDEQYLELSAYEVPDSLREQLDDPLALDEFVEQPILGACYERLADGVMAIDCHEAWTYTLSVGMDERTREMVQLAITTPEDGESFRNGCPGDDCVFNPYCSFLFGRWGYWQPPWGGPCMGYFKSQCGC